MMKKLSEIVSLLLAVAVILSVCSFSSFADNVMPEADEYGFVDVGDTKIEYAVYGSENSRPLLILTGNGGDMHGHDGNIAPELTEYYKVICVSVRGTGNTALGTDELTFELEALDLTKVLDYLGIEKTYIYGFSDGANLAIVFSLLYPERVEKMAVQSPNINIFGTKTKTQLQIMYQYLVLCIECTFKNDPDYVRRREIKGMMAHQPDLEFSDLENIKIPVLHIYAEKDMMWRWHSVKISESIPDCKSIMIEDATHTSAFEQSDTVIIPALTEFFG